MAICVCGSGNLNTGRPTAEGEIRQARIIVFVDIRDNLNAYNEILGTQSIDQAFLDGKTNNDNISQRFYPVGPFFDVQDTREEPKMVDRDDTTRSTVLRGRRTYMGKIVGCSPVYEERINKFKERKVGVYGISACGDLIGAVNSDGTALRPIPINQTSLYATYNVGNNDDQGILTVAFDYLPTFNDSDMRQIPCSDVTDKDAILNIEGLKDLKADLVGTASGTGFTINLREDYDSFPVVSTVAVEGWDIDNFKLVNLATNMPVAITSVTQAPVGTYAFVYGTLASGTKLRLTNVKTSGERPGYALEIDVTIP